jgi:hypothetical protein
LVRRAHGLGRRLTERFDPDAPFGWRTVHRGGVLIDHPGMLDGASGIGLALLAAHGMAPAAWGRAFLLQ